MPSHNASRILSYDSLENKAIKDAVKEALGSFVPVKKKKFRAVETGDGAVGQAASMLNNDNCAGATQLLTKHLAANPNDARANYNMGVAIECSSKGVSAHEYYLVAAKAYGYYQKAVGLDPSNNNFNKAQAELKIIMDQLSGNQKEVNRVFRQKNLRIYERYRRDYYNWNRPYVWKDILCQKVCSAKCS